MCIVYEVRVGNISSLTELGFNTEYTSRLSNFLRIVIVFIRYRHIQCRLMCVAFVEWLKSEVDWSVLFWAVIIIFQRFPFEMYVDTTFFDSGSNGNMDLLTGLEISVILKTDFHLDNTNVWRGYWFTIVETVHPASVKLLR